MTMSTRPNYLRAETDAGISGVANPAFMRRALHIAGAARGRTAPNPMVGAVVVRDGQIVGEGYHRRCGGPHAEVLALKMAAGRATGATMYVTLEPCAHHGCTPPCVDALIAAQISRVVVAAIDPDQRVDGRGVAALRRAGISVEVGLLGDEERVQNYAYFCSRIGAKPVVTLKMAITADARVAREVGRRDRVTGPQVQRQVHAMRAEHDAIVIGVETARVDQPRLDCRVFDAAATLPIPVVLDTGLRLNADNRWAREGRSYVVLCAPGAPGCRRLALERAGARVVACESGGGGVDIHAAVEALVGLGLPRIFVEGGPSVFRSFLKSGCWNTLYLFESSRRFGGSGVPLNAGRAFPPMDAVALAPLSVGPDTLYRWIRRENLIALRRRTAEGV